MKVLLGMAWVLCLGTAGILLYQLKSVRAAYESELRADDAARVMQVSRKAGAGVEGPVAAWV